DDGLDFGTHDSAEGRTSSGREGEARGRAEEAGRAAEEGEREGRERLNSGGGPRGREECVCLNSGRRGEPCGGRKQGGRRRADAERGSHSQGSHPSQGEQPGQGRQKELTAGEAVSIRSWAKSIESSSSRRLIRGLSNGLSGEGDLFLVGDRSDTFCSFESTRMRKAMNGAQ